MYGREFGVRAWAPEQRQKFADRAAARDLQHAKSKAAWQRLCSLPVLTGGN